MLRYEILVDRTERPRKCTILPLAYRDDFRIRRFDRGQPIEALTGHVLLHPDGVPLARRPLGAFAGHDAIVVSAIDCNWLRLGAVVTRIAAPLPRRVRIPDGFLSAYHRRNKQNLDPQGGLATIEALFLASAFLGVWDETLLREYPVAADFLRINAAALASHGLGERLSPSRMP